MSRSWCVVSLIDDAFACLWSVHVYFRFSMTCLIKSRDTVSYGVLLKKSVNYQILLPIKTTHTEIILLFIDLLRLVSLSWS